MLVLGSERVPRFDDLLTEVSATGTTRRITPTAATHRLAARRHGSQLAP